jgi:hypothetical protein
MPTDIEPWRAPGYTPSAKVRPTDLDRRSRRLPALLQGLDPDRLAEFAQVLFQLNGFRRGPVKGYYVVVETEPGAVWQVGQLCADPDEPLRLIDERRFTDSAEALKVAEALRAADPPRY